MKEQLQRIVELLNGAQHAWAFTGAGVGTESGIPDFRSSDSGIWADIDPMEVASVEGFLYDTPHFYEFWHWRFGILSQAEPNITHHWLASLEQKGLLRGVMTQNIDGLHRKSGSETVYELHGCYKMGSCIQCRNSYTIEEIFERAQAEGKPRCDDCSGLLKPNVTLFGEQLPPAFFEALSELEQCDLLLVLGTSLEVFPAAEIVPQVKRLGADVVLINAEATGMDMLADVVLHEKLKDVIQPLSEMI